MHFSLRPSSIDYTRSVALLRITYLWRDVASGLDYEELTSSLVLIFQIDNTWSYAKRMLRKKSFETFFFLKLCFVPDWQHVEFCKQNQLYRFHSCSVMQPNTANVRSHSVKGLIACAVKKKQIIAEGMTQYTTCCVN